MLSGPELTTCSGLRVAGRFFLKRETPTEFRGTPYVSLPGVLARAQALSFLASPLGVCGTAGLRRGGGVSMRSAMVWPTYDPSGRLLCDSAFAEMLEDQPCRWLRCGWPWS